MAQFPQGLGVSVAGTVVAVGPGVERLSVGDKVFGFFFHNEEEKGQQVSVTAPEHLFGRVGISWSLSGSMLLASTGI
jgi:NADPH:quinone reductase-like Zn-dependent oxidoreductase